MVETIPRDARLSLEKKLDAKSNIRKIFMKSYVDKILGRRQAVAPVQ